MGVNLSLRAKLLLLIVAVVICFGGAISFYLKTRLASKFSAELFKRGEVVARHLAELSAEAFIENDHLRLQYLANEHKATDADIHYILMIDPAGNLLAHSFGPTVPDELITANRYVAGREVNTKRLDTGDEIVYDIAVPVLDGSVGSLRVGMSTEPIQSVVKTLLREIILTIVCIGLLAFALTLPVAQAITRPLFKITKAIEGLSAGRRDLHLSADRRDEIGLLNDAFNQMTTDIRKAERRLAGQINFLRILMDDLPIPVFYKDIEGRMLGCNRSFANFWGKSIEEIIGSKTRELFPLEDAILHEAKDAEALQSTHPIVYEQTVTGGDGAQHYVTFHKSFYRDEDERPAGIIGVIHDITSQREADQMKRDFVSIVAHEFQTPLATILGFCELLSIGAMKDEDSKDALERIAHKAETMSQMVNDLLDLARLENGQALHLYKEACDLNTLLSGCIDGFRKRVVTHQFSLELPTKPFVMNVDGKRIEQVIDNLLSNAVKYSGQDSTIHVVAVNDGDVFKISVRDQGVGMSPSQTKHLFDKFYRVQSANASAKGTGLGLFIAKSIVDAHHGNILVDSLLGQGTTVTVTLPVAARLSAAPPTSPVHDAGGTP